MKVIGIDPGLTGALALIDHTGLAAAHDMPTIENGSQGRIRRWVDAAALNTLLRHWCSGADVNEILIVLERPTAMPDQDVSTLGSCFDTFGAIRGVIGARGYRLEIITSQKWKRFFGLIGDKNTKSKIKHASMDMALRFYPLAPLEKAKHHNRAEAILIARWGHTTYA